MINTVNWILFQLYFGTFYMHSFRMSSFERLDFNFDAFMSCIVGFGAAFASFPGGTAVEKNKF